MNLIINGKPKEVATETTVSDILQELGINSDSVVVELNQSILPPEKFGEQYLKEEDKLEVIRFVGGG